ncbi:MAG: hypothetical protein WD740_02940 [Anaerolineales bacterium]
MAEADGEPAGVGVIVKAGVVTAAAEPAGAAGDLQADAIKHNRTVTRYGDILRGKAMRQQVILIVCKAIVPIHVKLMRISAIQGNQIQSLAMKTQNHKTLQIIILVSLGVLLASCGQGGRSPDRVVESYLTALVAKDDVTAVNLSCVAWEANAEVEGAAFEGVEVTLDNLACSVEEQNGESATVACGGKIVFSYAGGENEVIDLGSRQYSVVLEGGDWRMCGYK